MQLDEEARVQEVRLERSVIHNHCRFSYGQAQAILNGGEHRYAEEVRTLGRLAKILRARRKEEEGSLDLSLEADPEKESHQLIEEFMLLANEQVARFLDDHHPEGLCLSRPPHEVNELDWGPLDQVGQFLKCPVRIKDQPSVQQALEAMLDHPHFDVLRFHVGRALKKASYHFEALGHGALAKQHYAHFTSPIRRYSDLILHRLLEDVLYREERSGSSCYDRETLGMICEHINQMEIRVDSGSFESHRLRDLQRFDGPGRVRRARSCRWGRVSVRLQWTDLSVTARYFTERPVQEEMPLRVTDRDTGELQLGQTVRVRQRESTGGGRASRPACWACLPRQRRKRLRARRSFSAI